MSPPGINTVLGTCGKWYQVDPQADRRQGCAYFEMRKMAEASLEKHGVRSLSVAA